MLCSMVNPHYLREGWDIRWQPKERSIEKKGSRAASCGSESSCESWDTSTLYDGGWWEMPVLACRFAAGRVDMHVQICKRCSSFFYRVSLKQSLLQYFWCRWSKLGSSPPYLLLTLPIRSGQNFGRYWLHMWVMWGSSLLYNTPWSCVLIKDTRLRSQEVCELFFFEFHDK